MTHFLQPQFVITLALVKNNRTFIRTYELNQFRIDLEKKISDLDYSIMCSDFHIKQLMISFSDFFEKKGDFILSKVDLDKIIRTFVVYLPNVLLRKVFEDD